MPLVPLVCVAGSQSADRDYLDLTRVKNHSMMGSNLTLHWVSTTRRYLDYNDSNLALKSVSSRATTSSLQRTESLCPADSVTLTSGSTDT